MLKMIDVSAHQRDVDWKRVANAGIRIVGIKTSEGQDWPAPGSAEAKINAAHMKGAKSAGLTRLPYHYLRPRADRNGAVEARWAVKAAKALGWNPGGKGVWRGRDLPLCIDVEWDGNTDQLAKLGPARAWEYASDFCDEAYRLTGRRCIFYTAPGFMPLIDNRMPRNCVVAWVADPSSPDGKPETPPGVRPGLVKIHQTDFHGRVPGINGDVDLNLFLGTQAELNALIAGGVVPKPKPPKPQPLTTREVQTLLKQIGWPVKVDGKRGAQTVTAIKDFQRGYGRKRLTVDGVVGAQTAAALEWSAANDGRASEHFRFREFASKRSGWIKTHRDLVNGLEKLRAHTGKPIGVLSGYRDYDLGARNSQHHFGNAIDPTSALPHYRTIAALKAFSGIGYYASTGLVRHVDVRHAGPNTTGGSLANPTVFVDAYKMGDELNC